MMLRGAWPNLGGSASETDLLDALNLGLGGRARPWFEMFELKLYWRSIAKRKWAILAVAVVAAAIAGIVALMMTPIYRATGRREQPYE